MPVVVVVCFLRYVRSAPSDNGQSGCVTFG